MFLTRPLPDDFRERCWRRRPCMLEGMISPAWLATISLPRFYSWCTPPAKARLYSRTEEFRPGTAVAGLIPDVTGAPALFEPFRSDANQVTLLLNRVEQVDAEIRALRETFDIGLAWRYDDVVATMSTAGSGIGYHAGHEDGFIVQLQGSREWTLYDSRHLPAPYRNRLLGDRRLGDMPAPPRPDADPAFTGTLHAGDVLYIPALMGHEGVTIDDSISLSVGWRGISIFECIARCSDHSPDVTAMIDAAPELFFRLLDDPSAGASDVPAHLVGAMEDALEYLGALGPGRGLLRQYFNAMVNQ
jgi:50S ribosomal protein L16 3-hydroxylase